MRIWTEMRRVLVYINVEIAMSRLNARLTWRRSVTRPYPVILFSKISFVSKSGPFVPRFWWFQVWTLVFLLSLISLYCTQRKEYRTTRDPFGFQIETYVTFVEPKPIFFFGFVFLASRFIHHVFGYSHLITRRLESVMYMPQNLSRLPLWSLMMLCPNVQTPSFDDFSFPFLFPFMMRVGFN